MFERIFAKAVLWIIEPALLLRAQRSQNMYEQISKAMSESGVSGPGLIGKR